MVAKRIQGSGHLSPRVYPRWAFTGRPFCVRPVTLDHAKIIDLHKKGNGATAIAKSLGCSRGAVYKVLGLNGG